MNTLYGYLIAGLGLIGMGLSSQIGKQFFPVLSAIHSNYILYPSLVLVAIGVVILITQGTSSSSGKIKHVTSEVPIYQGEGKKRRIVGYRVEE